MNIRRHAYVNSLASQWKAISLLNTPPRELLVLSKKQASRRHRGQRQSARDAYADRYIYIQYMSYNYNYNNIGTESPMHLNERVS